MNDISQTMQYIHLHFDMHLYVNVGKKHVNHELQGYI